jgi:hypothetical protein
MSLQLVDILYSSPKNLIGKIVKCPVTVCESGMVKIVGYVPEGNPLVARNWQSKFLGIEFIPGKETGSQYFEITLEELESWL